MEVFMIMKKVKEEQELRSITSEAKKFSLEKQVSIVNEIIENVNNVIDGSMSHALSRFNVLIKDLGSLKDKKILLLQPEKYTVLAVFFCLNGASIVYGLNRFVKSEERLSTYYEKLLDFILKNKGSVILQQDLSDYEIIKQFNEIVSIDKHKMLSYLNRNKIRFSVNEDASSMPYHDGLFDVVVSDNVMERLYYPFQSINEIRRVMAEGGLLYMRVNPNGEDVKTSRQLVKRLAYSRGMFEKSFSYYSSDYCNRLQKSDLLFYMNNFKLKVDTIKEVNKIKIADFDKKDIDKHFVLFGEDDISTLSFVVTAKKKSDKSDNFSQEDYMTYAKGLDLLYKGRYNAALARFESVGNIPQDDEVERPEEESLKKAFVDDRVTLGMFHTLYFLNDYIKAIDTFKEIKAPGIRQTVKNCYYFADSFYNIEGYEEAKKYFTEAESIDPKQHVIANAIGLCDYKMGNVKEALSKLRRSVRLFPYYYEGLNNIGMILETVSKRKAIEHFKMVLTICPGHHKALFSMGRLLYKEGWFEEAGKYLKEYCVVNGSDESALKMHIDCLIKLGLKRTAKKEMECLLEKDPTNTYVSNMFEEFMSDEALM
jgi:tetratricopeptide (TPR) repeat protein